MGGARIRVRHYGCGIRTTEAAPHEHAQSSLIPSFQRPASQVLIRRVGSYQQELAALMFESLAEFALPVKDKSVLLKPNLVGLDPHGLINTHPAVIAAARECFLRMGAAQVLVGDGPAMDRDTEAILESVRLREHLGPLEDVLCGFQHG